MTCLLQVEDLELALSLLTVSILEEVEDQPLCSHTFPTNMVGSKNIQYKFSIAPLWAL